MGNPFGNMGNLGGMMKQAKKLMDETKRIQDDLTAERVEASSGGGVVKAVVSGMGQLLEIKIDPQVVDPEDVEMLEDLVTTAVREALTKSEELRTERLQAVTGGLNLPGMF